MSRARFIAAARLEFLPRSFTTVKPKPDWVRDFLPLSKTRLPVRLPSLYLDPRFAPKPRRVFVQDFPFALIYRSEPDGIVIFAVAHHAKRPYYWQSRVRAR